MDTGISMESLRTEKQNKQTFFKKVTEYQISLGQL